MYVNGTNTQQAGTVMMTNLPKGGAAFGVSFGEALAEAQGTQKSGLSKADMTLDQYKQYISERISSLPMSHTAMQDCIVIKISDAGFANMQKDPEFEEWVIDSIKQTFSWTDPWNSLCGGKFEVIQFGTKIGQYHATSWYAGYGGGKGEDIFDQSAEDGFWERRAKKTSENIEKNAEQDIQQHQNELHAIRAQMQAFAPNGMGMEIMPVMSAADILFGTDMLSGGAGK